MTEVTEHMVCRTCLVALNYDGETGRWIHPLAQLVLVAGVAGHEPDPVPADSVLEHRYRCDFCFAPDPAWTEPAAPFVYAVPNEYEGGSADGWAACDECHALIVEGGVDALVAHIVNVSPAMQGMPRGARRRAARDMHTMVRQFMSHRTGEGYRQ